MNLQKYVNDLGGPNTSHKGWLYWSNPSQLPVRYQDREAGQLQFLGHTNEVFEYYCNLFDIMDPVQRTQYQLVVDRILSGWYKCCNRMTMSSDTSPRIWLEWIQRYRVPAGGRNG